MSECKDGSWTIAWEMEGERCPGFTKDKIKHIPMNCPRLTGHEEHMEIWSGRLVTTLVKYSMTRDFRPANVVNEKVF